MSRIEPFSARDSHAVAELQARVFPSPGWRSAAERAAYFCEVLLEAPWADAELPSWVAKDGERVVGFFGVASRHMRFGDRTLRVAVGCQLMVDPQARPGLVALQLMRRYFSGPQDLSVADGANDASRSLWQAAGGISSSLHALHWVLLLRPVQSLWQRAARGRRALGMLGAPFAALADACVARLQPLGSRDGLREEPLDARSLLAAQREIIPRVCAMRPEYDEHGLAWLLAQAAAKKRHGELEGRLVLDAKGVVGWYLYYRNRGTSQVVQLGARRARMRDVLGCLAHRAREGGALALEGRMEPQLAAELAGSRTLLENRGIAFLLQARDPRLLLSFLRGDAFFSRLDGEWWMRFSGAERPQPASEAPVPLKKRRIVLPAKAGT